MKKVRLTILGLSNSQSQMGAYALILGEENGNRRLPIIIGAFEAQSIALQMEGMIPPRPLTHDLFFNFSKSFDIEVTEVQIHKLEEGIFFSLLICRQNDKVIKIDARTSDAVSLALRFNCPIFTSPSILEKAGFDPDQITNESREDEPKSKGKRKTKSEFDDLSLEELEFLLGETILNEDYEKASLIRDEINRRKAEKPSE